MKGIGFKLLVGTAIVCALAWAVGYLGYLQ